MATSLLQYGVGMENVVLLEHGYRDVEFDREPREGSEWLTSPGGAEDAWLTGLDFTMTGTGQYLPYSSDPAVTTPLGSGGWQDFLNWVRDKNTFRFVPDAAAPDFYVDGCFWVEPLRGGASPRTQALSDFRFKMRHPTQDFLRMMRGVMFEWAPGMSTTDPVVASFVRTTAATRRGVPRSLLTAIGASDAAGALRDRHYVGTLRTALLERARTQGVANPENFGAWTAVGTPVLTSGQSDPFGGTSAYLIEDNDAAAFEHLTSTGDIAFTDGEKAFSLFVKQGSATSSWFRIRGGGVDRHRVIITWTAGVPALSTGSGSGTLFPVEDWGGGWWRVSATATGVVGADTNLFEFGPGAFAASGVGTGYFFGANAWDSSLLSSYQGPSLGTRNEDDFDWPFLYKPQAMFMFIDYVSLGVEAGSDGNSFVMEIGSAFQDGRIILDAGSTDLTAYHQAQGASVNQSVSGVPARGDRVQMLLILNANGSVQLKRTINLGAESASGTSGALAFRSAWNPERLFFWGGSGSPFHGVVRAKAGPLAFSGASRDTIAKVLIA